MIIGTLSKVVVIIVNTKHWAVHNLNYPFGVKIYWPPIFQLLEKNMSRWS
jgi:hypothetical protein